MFRSFIYLDEDKLYTYKRLIDGHAVQPKSISKKKIKSASAGLSQTALSYRDEESITADIDKDPFWDYDRFELTLSNLSDEEYFDFVLREDEYDISLIPPMKIVRLSGNMTIPKEFDIFNLIENYKPILMNSLQTSSEGENELVNAVFSNTTADVPVVVECGDVSIVGRLSTKWLQEDYTSLEDYAEQDITMLFKVVGMNRKENVTIFNPLKDFIKLNRELRRSGKFDDNGSFAPIVIAGPVVKVEFIALYK